MKKNLLYLILLCACSAGKINSTNTTSTPSSEKISLLEQISKNPEKYIGQNITIDAVFMGYKGQACSFADGFASGSPVSRSDWFISDGKFCAYAHGPTPNNLNPMTDKEVEIKLHARIKTTNNNKLYLLTRKN